MDVYVFCKYVGICLMELYRSESRVVAGVVAFLACLYGRGCYNMVSEL
jgi:hypothetical protein